MHEGLLKTADGGWVVARPDGAVVARIETWDEPARLRLVCTDDDWTARWDDKQGAFVALRGSRTKQWASLARTSFGADAHLTLEPDGAEVKLDLRRVPKRRWYLGHTEILTDDDDETTLLRFTGRAHPLLLMLALWHVALSEGDDPKERRRGTGPFPLADKPSPWGPPMSGAGGL